MIQLLWKALPPHNSYIQMKIENIYLYTHCINLQENISFVEKKPHLVSQRETELTNAFSLLSSSVRI